MDANFVPLLVGRRRIHIIRKTERKQSERRFTRQR